MIIDSHAHIYSEDLETYPTIADPLRPPPGTGTPAGLQEAMRSCGVDRAMLVQTTTFYEWDNTFVRDVGTASDDWARSVVTLNPEDPHSPDVLFALYERANARALRTYPVGRQDYDHPGNRRLISAARDLGITVNALLGELRSADELATVLADFPDCNFVLDHCLALEIGPDNSMPNYSASSNWRRFPTCTPSSRFSPRERGRNSRSRTCTARAGASSMHTGQTGAYGDPTTPRSCGVRT